MCGTHDRLKHLPTIWAVCSSVYLYVSWVALVKPYALGGKASYCLWTALLT